MHALLATFDAESVTQVGLSNASVGRILDSSTGICSGLTADIRLQIDRETCEEMSAELRAALEHRVP